MNEVQTMAKAGENVGSAVGTAVGTALMSARQGALSASKNSAAVSRRMARKTAKQARKRLAEHGIDRQHLQDLQDVFAENLWRARHELATKIEPPVRSRRRPRKLLLIAVLGAIAGAIAAVFVKRPTVTDTEHSRTLERDMSSNGSAPRQLQTSQAGTTSSTATRRTSTTGESSSTS